MWKIILTLLILLISVKTYALEIHQEPVKYLPPLSVHDFHNCKKNKKIKLIILPLFDLENMTISGIKIEIRINEFN